MAHWEGKLAGPKSKLTIHLPLHIVLRVRAYAAKYRMSVSRAIGHCVCVGLDIPYNREEMYAYPKVKPED